MSDLTKQLAVLSDEKRQLLEILLQEENGELNSFPLSFAQQRLWFLDQLESGSPLYNIPVGVRMKGKLDAALLERCFLEVIRRHEALRTVFAAVDGEPVQVIGALPAFTLPIVDLRDLPPPARETRMLTLATEEAQRPFDLSRGPLMRATLLRLAEQEQVLLLTMHHIISDGWSAGILVREVAALYEAYTAGRPSPLPELPIQYADYALWQRNWLRGEVLEEQLSFWRQRLAGRLPALELPLDYTRPAVETFRGARIDFQLGEKLAESLKALSRSEGTTLFMTLLAAYNVLLYRYTGQPDILVATPVAGRNSLETEALMGFFVNTLVLRTDLGGNPPFRVLLGRVRQMMLESYAHGDLPFEKLVEELQPERDMSRNPLFQVMFVLQNAPLPPLELPELTMSVFEVDSGTSKFDLTLNMQEDERGLNGAFEYNTSLFKSETIERMIGHFQTLLRSIVENPEQHIDALSLLRGEERFRQLVEWNATRADYQQERCVHQLFEAQAERTPDASAVVFEDQSLTYAELNARANQLAHYIQRLGVGPEVLVGICLERSLEMVIALLAVAKAGGAMVALDPTTPRQRLAFMMEDARAAVLLTERGLLDVWSEIKVVKVCLDHDWQRISTESTDNPSSRVSVENPLYAIYTSGSTGVPKGISVPHRAFLNLLQWQFQNSGLSRQAKTVQFATFGFCVSFQEIFACLCSGSTLVMLPDDKRRNVEALTQVLAEQRIERLHLPFAALKHLAEVNAAGERLRTSLREVITAGEQLQITKSIASLFERLPGCSLHNQYGASETHVVSAHALAGTPAQWPNIPPVGRPVANTQIYLLNSALEPVPAGVAGELYAGGACLARGYINDPALTAAKFIPDPFSPEPGARLYRTGDLARFLPDGNIEYFGRADLQVKIRGFRIELGEIETLLSQHASVRDAAVVAHDDEHGNKRLVAYLVLHDEKPSSLSALRSFLKEKLPEYMLPATFILLNALPLNPNGKLDQQALPAPDFSNREQSDSYDPPRTPVEEVLAAIWAEVLGLESVGRQDNFFQLGGHSLLATRIMSRVRSAFEKEIPLRVLFNKPTLAEFAAVIEEELSQASRLESAPVLPMPRGRSVPLSFAQQRIWYYDQLEPGTPSNNLPAIVRLRGALDAATLERAFNEIIRRHEILRTSFTLREGVPVQVVAPSAQMLLTEGDDLRPAEARDEEALRRLARAEAQHPFDLERAPLMRAKLLRISRDESLLLLVMHHIVSDGWSISILIRELAAIYAAYASGNPSPLEDLTVQYADFAHWQRAQQSGEALAQQLAYWTQQLAAPRAVLELPAARTNRAARSFKAEIQTFVLPRDVSESLKGLSRREGASLYMTLLASFKTLLHRHTGEEDILVGSPIAGRTRAETEDLIGCFINTLVMRSNLGGDPTFRELLRRVREVTLGAYAHQDVPFELLVGELQPERDMNRNPLFQVMFVLHNNSSPDVETSGLRFSYAQADNGMLHFDLILSMSEEDGGLVGAIGYNSERFKASGITRLMSHFHTLLESIAANPEQRLSELRLFSEDETESKASVDFPEVNLSQKDFENLILELDMLSDEE
jgi:amino acid adenylation domain-containing protein